MPRPYPPDPDQSFPWEDDDQAPGLSIRPLSHAELGELVAELRNADPDQPAQAVLDHWMPPPAPIPAAQGGHATAGRPGGSAKATWRRRRSVERSTWARTLPLRLAGVLATGIGAGLLAARILPRLALVAGLLGAAGVGWLVRFRPSQETTAWRRGAAGERHTARLLARLDRRGWAILHDLAVPGSRANIDHLAIGPAGVFVLDSKQYSGRLQLDPHGQLWHGRYPLAAMLAAVRFEAEQAAQVLAAPGVEVVPIVAVHGAPIPWGKLVVDGVPVVPARRLPSMLRSLPAVLGPGRVAGLSDRAGVRFHAAA
jgi:Nuclease-related domain